VGYEKLRFLTNIWLYLGNDTRQTHGYYTLLVASDIRPI